MAVAGPDKRIADFVAAVYRFDRCGVTRTAARRPRPSQARMSKREIIRCLKRYVAHENYRHIQPTSALAASPSAA
ncbi:hypothetical protein [Streptomyces marokkonensis]|uniref:hypothetical protein n=1 Tax=Streptomyces marokkonensis TaxID=324855 RepID=UPI00142F0C96|nr:hypothetical protein [Streptomyces marokkonensis]